MDRDIDELVHKGGGGDLYMFYQHCGNAVDFDREKSRSQYLHYIGVGIDSGRILLKIRDDAIVESYQKAGLPIPKGDISLRSGSDYIAYYNRIWPEQNLMNESDYDIQVIIAIEANARVWWPTVQGFPDDSFLNYPENDIGAGGQG